MAASQDEMLLEKLRKVPKEIEWIEFKLNNAEPKEIGEYISALSNAVALHGERHGYILWGVNDTTKQVEGTTFRPQDRKIGNEALVSWLHRHLAPNLDFRIRELDHHGKHMVLFEIPQCTHTPIRFADTAYIRVGTYKKKLRDFPEKERKLWLLTAKNDFETSIALEGRDIDSNPGPVCERSIRFRCWRRPMEYYEPWGEPFR